MACVDSQLRRRDHAVAVEHVIEDPVAREDTVRVEQEERERPALPPSAKAARCAALPDLKRAEDPELQALGGHYCSRPVSRTVTPLPRHSCDGFETGL